MVAGEEHPPHRLGRWGERVAERFLTSRGWQVVARNYRFRRNEVDLVMSREGLVAFVEVKTRAGEAFGEPSEAITGVKRRDIERVARHFLLTHPGPWTGVRFDAVSIVRTSRGGVVRLEHIEDAWRPGWP